MKIILIVIGILLVFVGLAWFFTQGQPPITKTAQVTLSVKPAPDFTLEVTPVHIDSPIGRTVAYNAQVTSVNNFAGDITFSITGLPAGFTVTYFPGPTLTLGPDMPRGVQINIAIADDPALVADYTITVKAESMNYN